MKCPNCQQAEDLWVEETTASPDEISIVFKCGTSVTYQKTDMFISNECLLAANYIEE